MWTALLWGLVQGLTEFLPISSSGHLVLVPALVGLPAPDLAMTVILHLGTLVAVIAYYRRDLLSLMRFGSDPRARRIVGLLALGTVPAAVFGLLLEEPVGALFMSPSFVALSLVATGIILLIASSVAVGARNLDQVGWRDSVLVGLAQSMALLPGISRSGITIAAGLTRGIDGVEAARFSFLLAVPAIAGAGLLEAFMLEDYGRLDWTLLGGLVAAAVSGYASIAVLLRALGRYGLRPFSWYCLAAGAGSFLYLVSA